MTKVWDSLLNRIASLRDWAEKKPVLQKFLYISSEILLFLIFVFVLALSAIYPFNLVLIGIVGLFSVELIAIILLYGRIVIDKFVILLLLLLVTEFVSNAVNGLFGWTQNGLLMIALAGVIYEYCRQYEGEGKRALIIFTLASWVFAALFFWQYWQDMIHPNINNRIGSFFDNVNNVARHAAYSVILNILFAYNAKDLYLKFGKGGNRGFNIKIPMIVVGVLGALYFFYVIILTGSISNLLTTCLVIAIFIASLMWKKSKVLCIAVISIGIVLFFVALQLPFMEYFRTRLLNMLGSLFSDTSDGDGSFLSRLHGFLYSMVLWSQRLIFGTGGDAGIYSYFYIMAHNNIGQTVSYYGLFALVIEEIILFLPLVKTKGKDMNILLLSIYFIFFQLFLITINSKVDNVAVAICASLIPEASMKLKKKELVKTREAVI